MSRRMESFLCFFQLFMLVVVILVHNHHHTCDATNTNNQTHCPPTSCGKLSNIKHPFRLKDDPKICGDSRFEFSCENNMTVLNLFSGKYYVKSIDYRNYTIRVVDPGIVEGDCSTIPRYFLTPANFTSSYNLNHDGLSGYVIYLNCSKPVKNDPIYVDTSSCVKWHSKGHLYAVAGDIKTRSLNVGCDVKLVAITSASPFNTTSTQQYFSYAEIHGMLSYGFDLSWIRWACEDSCDSNQQNCEFDIAAGGVFCEYSECMSPLGTNTKCGFELNKNLRRT
ncbi:uncharacterized protein LOC131596053 [Vicia villosa]|uniref:uncharacterized protein LOC131596053 n=1 Tax=Vicia villosa TaxID=3911 RepID=UPI00273AD5D3|nr:uncharacterized protein LOC131596053 [Vicia villosa]